MVWKTPKSARKESLLVRKNIGELSRNPTFTKKNLENLYKIIRDTGIELLSDKGKKALRRESKKAISLQNEESVLIDRFFEKMAKYNYKNPRLRKAFIKMMLRREIENEINKCRQSNIKKEEKRKREEELRKLKESIV
ncbi:MAG: hypothetical protein N3D73_01210 [Candidatus Diapherotrites archaeon]|nr:hypothetical protein [Candidatus Diapherotrites archaeon]